MEGMKRVYAVDDEEIILDLMAAALEGEYLFKGFTSGERFLAQLSDVPPDIVMLDVFMPGRDGLSLCRQLKGDFLTQDIPVIFVSGDDDAATRMKCYEAGGEDFLLKPVEPEDLMQKLKIASRIIDDKEALKDQAGYAQRTAMSAMVSMSELGVVLQFLSKSFTCDTLPALGNAILEAMRQFDLKAAVQMRLGGSELTMSDNGRDVPLEISVLRNARDSGRIFQFRSRCVFNYGGLTLMLNNMPVDDVEKCGRIRDNVAILAEGAGARLKALESDLLARQRREGIEQALPGLRSTLEAVQANYRRNCFELTQNMIDYQEILTKSFVSMGLTERQEEKLTAMASDFMQRMVSTQDASLEVVSRLEGVTRSLEGLLQE